VTASKEPLRDHDPNVCGLIPCDACRAQAERAKREFYERDAEARERGRLRAIGERITKAMGISLTDLRAVLVPIMAEDMAAIASAVFEERTG
jgi:hypothetical protein